MCWIISSGKPENASVICVIPVLFYDLSEKKHADYIRALKIRAAVRNYKDHTMGEDDIKNIKTISEYAKVENNALLLQELAEHSCIEAILQSESCK